MELLYPKRKLEDMREIQELQQMYPNLKTFEYRLYPGDQEITEFWTSDPPLPPASFPGQAEAAWPPRGKFLERIVVFWLDPPNPAQDTAAHEFWVFGGLNAMPEEGFMYYMARYIVRKEEKTITCMQEIQMLEGGWTDDHTLALEYMRRCLPWLDDYTLVQTCRMNQERWPAGEALMAAFTEGEVLETKERLFPEDDD